MRPKQHETRGSGDLFRARLDQIINMRHELAQLAGKIDWDFIEGEIAPLYSDSGRPGIATRFVIGLFLLKHIYGLSDKGVCERLVYDPYFQHNLLIAYRSYVIAPSCVPLIHLAARWCVRMSVAVAKIRARCEVDPLASSTRRHSE
jgi:hypothetical protein